jgi:hypothetical protein
MTSRSISIRNVGRTGERLGGTLTSRVVTRVIIWRRRQLNADAVALLQPRDGIEPERAEERRGG